MPLLDRQLDAVRTRLADPRDPAAERCRKAGEMLGLILSLRRARRRLDRGVARAVEGVERRKVEG